MAQEPNDPSPLRPLGRPRVDESGAAVLENDLRLELRTRNNRLWHLIFDTSDSVAAWCRTYNFRQEEVGGYLNLSRSPYTSTGQPRRLAEAIATVCHMLVEDLFPKDLYDGRFPMRMSTEIPSSAYLGLAAAKQLALPPSQEDAMVQEELRAGIKSVLETITPRERRVICARFGFDDESDGRSLEEVAEENGVSTERIRQIQAKALRKLRHPSRLRKLAPYIELSVEDPQPTESAQSGKTDPVVVDPISSQTNVTDTVYFSQEAYARLEAEVLQAGQELLDRMVERAR